VTGAGEVDPQAYAEALSRLDAAVDGWQQLRRSTGGEVNVTRNREQQVVQELQESLASFRTASRQYWAERGFAAE
jgi:predicted negative regulator of RcsB-dependent stress response